MLPPVPQCGSSPDSVYVCPTMYGFKVVAPASCLCLCCVVMVCFLCRFWFVVCFHCMSFAVGCVSCLAVQGGGVFLFDSFRL